MTVGMLLVPLIVGFVMLFLPRRVKGVSKRLAVVISLGVFVLSIISFSKVASGDYIASWTLLEIDLGTFSLDLELAAKPLGSFMLMFACGFGFLITLYSLKTMALSEKANTFYGAVLLTIGGSVGILLSQHLVFLLVFWEIVTLSLYLLVTTGKGSSFAATKSFAMIGASDAALLLGVLLTWSLSGSFIISEIAAHPIAASSALPIAAFLLLLIAAITKAGAMPMHTWLPTCGEVAPTSVMALLPAAIDKLLGIYLLAVIVVNMFTIQAGLSLLLMVIGAVTILVAVMIAMVQHNLKKLLSYHAVSQVGYMIIGIATMTPIGIAGGLFHMLNNAIYKCCLFLCGGAAEDAAGTSDLEEMGGLGRKMPITFWTCLIAALSISGIPLFNGFVSKWMVYQGVIKMGTNSAGTGMAVKLWPVWLTCAMFGSALTLASFVKFVHSIFLSRLPDRLKDVREAPFVKLVPMVVLAAICILFGTCYRLPLEKFIYPAMTAMGIETEAIGLSTWETGWATGLIIVGVLIGLGVLFVGAVFKKVRVVPTWTCGEVQTNEEMTIPGTHFYKTVSSMGGLKQFYSGQEKGHFDVYNQSGRFGLGVSRFLRYLHCGILPAYLTWVTIGLLIILFIVCKNIW
ncbi:MAG: NADH-quinone oxidoreductase subunit 5 family protein [Planctomycetota bacterium]|jgi:formate hydrogenlyase subunit 3/multisubunit Na+/H+ antiporter MnhD subunit